MSHALQFLLFSYPIGSPPAAAFFFSFPLTSARAVNKLAAEDSFHVPPPGFEAEPPGTILRTRRLPLSILTLAPGFIQTFQILYRTTATDGSPIASVTTVFKPLIAKSEGFISYQIAYDSAATQCQPSYVTQLRLDAFGSSAPAEFLIIELYTSSGYIVSMPDHEGPEAAFVMGRLTGMVVLDSMRAVSNFAQTLGLDDDHSIVGIGYSEGGSATAWAAALHPVYAPELPVKGWSAGGVPSNLTEILYSLRSTLVSGFQFIAVAGMIKPTAYRAQVKALFDQYLTAAGQDAIGLASRQCLTAVLAALPFQDILSTKYNILGADVAKDPALVSVLDANTLGLVRGEMPVAPMQMYHARPDEIVPYTSAARIRKLWCDQGATVKFKTFEAGGHLTTTVLHLAETYTFVQDAFADNVAPGCSQESTLSDALNPLALGVSLEPLVVNLVNWLAMVGKRDENWLRSIKKNKPIGLLSNALS